LVEIEVVPDLGFKSRFWTHQGDGVFIATPEIDLRTTNEDQLVDTLNTICPKIGGEIVYYQGTHEAVLMDQVPELLVFPKNIDLPRDDTPIATATPAATSRMRGLLMTINRVGEPLTEFQSATIAGGSVAKSVG
jgi:hypothetical protein